MSRCPGCGRCQQCGAPATPPAYPSYPSYPLYPPPKWYQGTIPFSTPNWSRPYYIGDVLPGSVTC